MPKRQMLNEKVIRELQPQNGKPTVYGDLECKGLRLLVSPPSPKSPAGRKTWQVCRGTKTTTLDPWPQMSLKEARGLASPNVPPATLLARRELVQRRTIDSYIDEYVAQELHDRAGITQKRRPVQLRQFLAGILDQPLSALTTDWIRRRQHALSQGGCTRKSKRRNPDGEDKGYQASTIRTSRNLAIIFARWLVRKRYLDQTPFTGLKAIKSSPSDIKFLLDQDRTNLKAACAVHPEPRIACIVMIAMLSGLRKKEIKALEWGDFDFAKQEINLRAEGTKTEVRRPAWMPPDLVAFILARRDRLPQHKPFHIPAFDHHWYKVRKLASLQVDDITFHGLRHTFATTLSRRDQPLAVVQKAIGHKSHHMTVRYLHALDEEVMKAVKEVDQNVRPYLPPAHLRGGGEGS